MDTVLIQQDPNISDTELVRQAKIRTTGRSITKAAQEYKEEIERIIRNVGLGAFPIITAKQEKKVGKYLAKRKSAAEARRFEVHLGLNCRPFGPSSDPDWQPETDCPA